MAIAYTNYCNCTCCSKSSCDSSNLCRDHIRIFAQIFLQGGSITEALTALQTGYTIESGNKLVDELFNRGGLSQCSTQYH